ncbi:MAG: 16S rRNA (adenine(1518)-N(6)/adenine(1519)-N(6))-dimethyltransferase RsmA [Oscillospiraceae bacterium]|nr:16S rRNA (adenine(1518)-N(6)/adenine(1519)-N(6))-dimethyltransferase RsmA [Oscillospiraceae bacterium]
MDLFSINSIKDILGRHGFHFSKSLGQNFLTKRYICEQIAEFSGITRDDCVLEIGPGIGSLTSVLAESAKKVVTVEIDRALLPVLSETLSEYDNIKVINSDIMKCDLKKIVDEEFDGEKPKVCANLPYYITTPILSFLIESKQFSSITTMIQKEVALRICAKPKTADYGAFSVFIQYYTEPELLFKVSPDNFIPQPKVDSAVVMLSLREKPPVSPLSEEFFFSVVKASFAQRRKQLVNGLHSAFGNVLSKEGLTDILISLGHKPTVRGEELSISEFSDISDMIYKKTEEKRSF